MWIFKMNFVHRGAATAAARRAARRNRSEPTDTASRGWISKLHVIAQSPLRLYLSSTRTALQLQIPSKPLRRAPVYCARRVYTRSPQHSHAYMRIPPISPPLKEGGYFVNE
jgi:hypothetical protein